MWSRQSILFAFTPDKRYTCSVPLITSANAREMAARSQEARRQRKMEREAAPEVPQTSPQSDDDNDEFVTARLVRVRKQLNRLDNLMETETDPQKLDRLASAQARLAEQERLMAGRPLPGSCRPPVIKQRTQVQDMPEEGF
jgi:hypothetical protein